MNQKRFELFTGVIVLGLIFLFLVLGGYSIDGERAARKAGPIGEEAVLFEEIEFSGGKIYCYNTDEGPRTALVLGKLFLWRCPYVTKFRNNNQDDIKTVAWISYDDEIAITVIGIETNLKNVKYIEAGKGIERIKKEIDLNEPIFFYWDEAVRFKDINAIALSENGELLFRYGHSKNGSYTDMTEDLRWYVMNGNKS